MRPFAAVKSTVAFSLAKGVHTYFVSFAGVGQLNNCAAVKEFVCSLRLLSLPLLTANSIHHNKKRPVGVSFCYGALEKTRTSTA